jgi:Flp pilus assembly protein TadG
MRAMSANSAVPAGDAANERRRWPGRRRQRGVTTVEIAIVGGVTLVLLFAVIEIGRAMFVLNTLGEVTRRSARIAAVCTINDPAIVEVALFNAPGDGTASSIIGTLTPANIAVEYLDRNGTAIADPVADFGQIYYVRTRIVNFQHEMLIPFAQYIITTPDFSTTLRRESLGVPREGSVDPC